MRNLCLVKFRALTAAVVAGLAVCHSGVPEAAAQFSASGRRPPKPVTTQPGPARPTPPRPTTRPQPQQDPGPDALIARYTGIVMQQPGAQFPLQRLAQLYRQRDGKLDQLVAEFERRAAQTGPNQWTALVALAGIYRQAGQRDRAVSTYEQAIGQKPQDPIPLVALGHLLNDSGDRAGAKQRFEQALPHLSTDAEREQLLRTLMGLCLELKDWDGAQRHHEQLVRRAKGSFYVRGELGRELLLRGQYERAVKEYEDVVRAATGDNRVLGPALRDLGKAQAKLGRKDDAMKTLRHALRISGSQSGIRREIYEIIVEIYRADDQLPQLIAELEEQQLNDFQQLRMLGSLYEETGQVAKALTTYQQALRKNARDVDTRIKVVQLLQIQGELDLAIKEYEALIQAAPRNPDFVFQLAEALIQRGDRQQALHHLQRLEQRSGRDEETLAALVDFYERVEESDRAMALLQKLSQMGVRDPRHLVELGERYWQQGDKEKAKRTWERILTVVTDRALARFTLGEVYLEHAMPSEGLDALREAMKLAPTKLKFRKAYALALERTGASASSQTARSRQYDEALGIWEELLENAGDDAHLAREARQHIVTLWSLRGKLERREKPLQRQLARQPPDLEAGRLLAEIQIRLKNYAAAEQTLTTVTRLAPGDVASLTSLERVLVLQRKLRPAIAVLQKLVEAEPKRAREYYQRMSEYAAELYADDEAVQYAARAVELNPDNPDGHKKLGDMYRRRQQHDKAIGAYRQAISKNDRMWPVYLVLAELLLSKGETQEADLLLRRVVRASPDDELVTRAARLSMRINMGNASLESLEKELLPVALGNPQKPLYRRLLVELYGAMTLPLVHQSRSPNPEEAARARNQLERIGGRAVKPLLDALNDTRLDQQRIAIELLSHIRNRGAGPALFAFATGTADPESRARAMQAVAALRDPALLPKLAELLAPGGEVRADESDPVIVAAAWGVASMESARSRPLLLELVESDAPSLRALGALGLGLIEDRRSIPLLGEVARSVERGPLPRAAAAHALGRLKATAEVETLMQLAEASDRTVRASAILALARVGAAAGSRVIADALTSPDRNEREAAAQAALVHATGQWRDAGPPTSDSYRVDVRSLLDDLKPAGYTPDQQVEALVALAPQLARAAAAATLSSPERASIVADALLVDGRLPGFAPLTPDLTQVADPGRQRAAQAAEQIAAAVVAPFVALATHPSAPVRALAIDFLAGRDESAAVQAVRSALDDSEERVQRTALQALAERRDPTTIAPVSELLAPSHPWSVRRRAAETLGAIAASSKDERAFNALQRAATEDDYALVREAAALALHEVDPERARSVLTSIAKQDAEPRVRSAARRGL